MTIKVLISDYLATQDEDVSRGAGARLCDVEGVGNNGEVLVKKASSEVQLSLHLFSTSFLVFQLC